MKEEDFLEKELRQLWKEPFPAVAKEEVETSWQRLSKKVKLPLKKRKQTGVLGLLSIAATLTVIIAGYFYVQTSNPTITSQNLTSEDKNLQLSDGSLVVLRTGAQLTHKKYFYGKREVSLEGEAFFKVAKDSLREFIVYSGSSTIKVMGTSFLVNGNKNDTEVKLYTGRVSVSIKGIGSSWGLIPGERLVYNNGKARIENFDVQMSFGAGNDYIDIDEMKMKDFIPFLKKRFGYEFSADAYDPEVRVTLRINRDDSLGNILKLLSIINNKNYEINEEQRKIVSIKE